MCLSNLLFCKSDKLVLKPFYNADIQLYYHLFHLNILDISYYDYILIFFKINFVTIFYAIILLWFIERYDMNFLHIISDPAIIVIVVVFTVTMVYTAKCFNNANNGLNSLLNFIKGFKKSDLEFRFKELDTFMTANPYSSNIWLEFKNSLVFSESV